MTQSGVKNGLTQHLPCKFSSMFFYGLDGDSEKTVLAPAIELPVRLNHWFFTKRKTGYFKEINHNTFNSFC